MANKKNKLKIISLGGMGEIGKNLTVIEYGKDIIAVDCGLSFPDEDMPGVDLVIPDFEYLTENADRFRGFLITHGHEDHIGALPYALKDFKVPVYGTRLTNALIKHKLDEARVTDAQLISVSPGEVITIGCFRIEFIKTNHSIAGAVALAITTPIGVVIHTGDFKMDYTPLDGEPMDIARLAKYGEKGVLLLLADSTNAEKPGHTPSEREIGKTFEHYFDIAQGRVIVATFASNIYRIQQIADVAITRGRVICLQGRSMQNTAAIATELGYLSIPEDKLVDLERLDKYKPNEICVITTGTQGEPTSGLSRMANASHRLNVGTDDMIIISASAIPGNEKGVGRVINQLCHNGAKVIYDRMADVHVSGHAQQEELKLMFTLTRPKFFIPAHGEYRHLTRHAELAMEMGLPRDNIFVLDIGEVVEFTRNKGQITKSVPTGSIMVDGSGVGDIGTAVLKDRKLLSEDGLFTVVMVLEKQTGKLLTPPEIISRGFIYMKDSEKLLHEAKGVVSTLAVQFEGSQRSEWSSIKNNIRSQLKAFLYERTKRRPIILPIVMEIGNAPKPPVQQVEKIAEKTASSGQKGRRRRTKKPADEPVTLGENHPVTAPNPRKPKGNQQEKREGQ